jgi:probable blue pigment (indigoidine) exporter
MIVRHGCSISSTETIVFSMENKWRWMLVTAIAPVAWGSTYVVTRELLPPDYPLWGALIRALPAGLLLLALARRLPRGSWWWRSLVLGVLNIGAFFVLVYLAAQFLPSSIASTVMATSAGVILLLAWPLLRQKPQLLSLVGAVIGFVGVVVMLSPGGTTINPWGVVVSLAAMTSSSVGFLLARRWGGGIPLLALTSWQLIAGSLLLLPVAAIVEGPPPALDGTQLVAFLYLTVFCTALAFVAWFAGLRHLPAGVVGVIGLLNPVTGVVLGTLVAGEQLGVPQVVGIGLVLTGVFVGQATVGRARRSPGPQPAQAASQ